MGVPTGPPLFFVAALASPELSEPDHHHAARVLRIRAGDEVTVSDGRGSWRTCRFGPSLGVDGEIVEESAVRFPVTIGFALTKATKPEFVVQKLTEVGVDHIVGFGADRSVVKWDEDKSAARLERWRGVAREAAMQSRRAWLPSIGEVTSFAAVAVAPLADVAPAGPAAPVMADMAGRGIVATDRVVLIGPEGGWSDVERSAGLERVRIGSFVLRAETAAVVAGGLLIALRDGLIGSGDPG